MLWEKLQMIRRLCTCVLALVKSHRPKCHKIILSQFFFVFFKIHLFFLFLDFWRVHTATSKSILRPITQYKKKLKNSIKNQKKKKKKKIMKLKKKKQQKKKTIVKTSPEINEWATHQISPLWLCLFFTNWRNLNFHSNNFAENASERSSRLSQWVWKRASLSSTILLPTTCVKFPASFGSWSKKQDNSLTIRRDQNLIRR